MSEKLNQVEAIYFSEERITKLKSVDAQFKEEVERDERRIISRFLEHKIAPLMLFAEKKDEKVPTLQ